MFHVCHFKCPDNLKRETSNLKLETWNLKLHPEPETVL